MSEEDIFGKYDGDIYFYHGNISRYGYDQLSTFFEGKEEKKEQALIVLSTLGGIPMLLSVLLEPPNTTTNTLRY